MTQHRFGERLIILLLGVGLVAVIAMTIFGIWNYFQHRSIAPQMAIAPTIGDPLASAIDANHHLPSVAIPADARLILSTGGGDILTTSDGTTFSATGLHGNDVSVSNDGKHFVYWRGVNLYLFHDGEEDKFNMTAQEGALGKFTWSVDGQTLLYVVSGSFDYYLNRVRLTDGAEAADPQQMGSFASLAGPAIINPTTGLVLVALNEDTNKTALYTLNLFCSTDNCMSTLKQIGAIPYNVNWITLGPDGDGVAFSEDSGNIYLYSIASTNITPLVVSTEHKTQPVFSPDGQHLAYLGASHQLYILNVNSKQVESVGGHDISDVNWIK